MSARFRTLEGLAGPGPVQMGAGRYRQGCSVAWNRGPMYQCADHPKQKADKLRRKALLATSPSITSVSHAVVFAPAPARYEPSVNKKWLTCLGQIARSPTASLDSLPSSSLGQPPPHYYPHLVQSHFEFPSLHPQRKARRHQQRQLSCHRCCAPPILPFTSPVTPHPAHATHQTADFSCPCRPPPSSSPSFPCSLLKHRSKDPAATGDRLLTNPHLVLCQASSLELGDWATSTFASQLPQPSTSEHAQTIDFPAVRTAPPLFLPHTPIHNQPSLLPLALCIARRRARVTASTLPAHNESAQLSKTRRQRTSTSTHPALPVRNSSSASRPQTHCHRRRPS